MKRKRVAAIVLVVVSVCVLAQATASVWDGIYSAEQAKRGESLYAKECASCHGALLEGRGQAPAADPLRSRWTEVVVSAYLFPTPFCGSSNTHTAAARSALLISGTNTGK